MTGLHAKDIIGRTVLDILPNIEPALIERYGRVALSGVPDAFETHNQDLGRTFEVRAFQPSAGQFAVTFQEVTLRKRAEVRLQLLASVFEHTQEGIVITDPNSVIMEVNDTFVRMTGYSRDELLGQTPRILRSGLHGPEFYSAMWMALLEEGVWRGEVWNRRKNGEEYPEQLTISAVLDNEGHPSHFVGVVVDISAVKRHEAELDRIAHYDALTGLPNRVLLNDRLRQAIARRNATRPCWGFASLTWTASSPSTIRMGTASAITC